MTSFREHPLLAGGQTAVTFAAPQVTDDLGNFENVARMEFFKVGLVTARPVGWLLNIGLTKDLENILETLVINDVTNADKVKIAGWHSHNQIVCPRILRTR